MAGHKWTDAADEFYYARSLGEYRCVLSDIAWVLDAGGHAADLPELPKKISKPSDVLELQAPARTDQHSAPSKLKRT